MGNTATGFGLGASAALNSAVFDFHVDSPARFKHLTSGSQRSQLDHPGRSAVGAEMLDVPL
jgi:hypothetical protein